MSDFLISMGRGLIAWCALCLIICGSIGGFYLFGNLMDVVIFGSNVILQGPTTITPGRLLAGAVGGLSACLLSASILGLAAAIFDMQQHLRWLTEATVDLSVDEKHDQPRNRVRSEPRLT